MKHFLVAICAILFSGCSQSSPSDVKDGDLIFQTSTSSQSEAIQKATGSLYSHMGIIFVRKGKPYVLEAVATVRYTPLDQWVARGNGKRFVVKRLKDAASILTPAAIQKLRDQARGFEGKPYDLTFEWSDTRIYCSELVWKMYDRALNLKIGDLQEIKQFNLSDPAVKMKLKERYGDHIPEHEPVISPVSMINSPMLATVAER